MGWELRPQGRGQKLVFTGRRHGYSKHAQFDRNGDYIGQATKKQTNAKKTKGK